ncbi:MAG: hypothetical protein ACI9YM_001055 [Brevundimonas sp.]|uniref:hypothetical protein n=1 Tax=Brevundimonas sp. TaxID=1871086 RepID=UPI0039E49644
MSWLDKLFGGRPKPERQLDFVYVRMPGDVQPVERHYLFEDPIEEQLKIRNLGFVSGGGTLQGPPDAGGERQIESTGVDVEAEDLNAVRQLLREILPPLGAPVGTQIEFTFNGEIWQDRLTDTGWILDESRSDLHPGFDV